MDKEGETKIMFWIHGLWTRLKRGERQEWERTEEGMRLTFTHLGWELQPTCTYQSKKDLQETKTERNEGEKKRQDSRG